MERDRKIVKLVDGIARTLPSDLIFGFDRRRLTPSGARPVRALRDAAARADRVRVFAYTDARGTVAHNDSLSHAQAWAVARMLHGDGEIPKQTWRVKGRGEPNPPRPGRHHRLHRRVEVILIGV